MTSQHDKPKRWLPRFSVRTLVIVVTLVCLYAACWGPTKKWGEDDVKQRLNERVSEFRFARPGQAIAPFIVTTDESHGSSQQPAVSHCYYFWFFGYVAKMPYERQLPVAVITSRPQHLLMEHDRSP